VLLRDAVKRALPEAAPKPGAFRKGEQPKEAKKAKSEKAEAAEPAATSAVEGGSQE
jgi:hypothetical protein